jgi:hypothetical protein
MFRRGGDEINSIQAICSHHVRRGYGGSHGGRDFFLKCVVCCLGLHGFGFGSGIESTIKYKMDR